MLILDEPTTGISVTQKEMLFTTMRQLAKDRGRTIIFVSHKLTEVEELCQEVIVLRQGRMVSQLQSPFQSEDLLTFMFGAEHAGIAESSERSQPGRGEFIQLEDVQLLGDKYTLPDISLQIRPGEILGLAGLEGSGQELLLRGLAGLARVLKGRLVFDGEEFQSRP